VLQSKRERSNRSSNEESVGSRVVSRAQCSKPDGARHRALELASGSNQRKPLGSESKQRIPTARSGLPGVGTLTSHIVSGYAAARASEVRS